MPEGIGEAVQLILDEKGITQMELAMRLGVSRAAWRKWCAERMSLRHIVAICIALDLRADIGQELVRLAGIPFCTMMSTIFCMPCFLKPGISQSAGQMKSCGRRKWHP